jgi:Mg-chelatase subunit ChlD
MIRCPNGHENPEERRFCSQCQAPLHGQQKPAKTADIVFCFDTTGSMGGQIEGLKAHAVDFAQKLNEASVHFRLGLVDFRDLRIREWCKVVVPLTENAEEFRTGIAGMFAGGGGDAPESSLDAIRLALEMEGYRGTVRKYIVVVTDAPPLVPDQAGGSLDDLIRTVMGDQQARLMIVSRSYPEWDTVKKKMGSRAQLIPITGDFKEILDRVVGGTKVG